MSANNQRVEFDINDVTFILHSNKNMTVVHNSIEKRFDWQEVLKFIHVVGKALQTEKDNDEDSDIFFKESTKEGGGVVFLKGMELSLSESEIKQLQTRLGGALEFFNE